MIINYSNLKVYYDVGYYNVGLTGGKIVKLSILFIGMMIFGLKICSTSSEKDRDVWSSEPFQKK